MRFINLINNQQTTISFVEYFGLLTLCYLFIYRPGCFILHWLINTCVSKRNNRKVLFQSKQPGDYAVITGATDGIGLEYAKQLASIGYNLILLSRNETKLSSVAHDIQEKYPQCSDIQWLVVDFSRVDIYDSIEAKLRSLVSNTNNTHKQNNRIYILVNNVGTTYHIPEYFAYYPVGYNQMLINVNIVSITRMCEIVLKIMLEQVSLANANIFNGIIINISSGAGVTEFPLFSTYSACK